MLLPTNEAPNTAALSQYLTKSLTALIPEQKARVKEVARLLNLTEGAVYKKLSGVSPFSAAEALSIAFHFKFSLDEFLYAGTTRVPVDIPSLYHLPSSAANFLRDIRDRMQAGTTLPGAHLFYATTEIPVFHYLHYPHLTAFKLFVWGRTTWELDVRGLERSVEDLAADPEIAGLCAQIVQGYIRLDSTEYWPQHLLENTLNQLVYFREERVFTHPDTYGHIVDELRQLVNHQQTMARHARKHLPGQAPTSSSGAFHLFHNEIAHTNNFFLLQSADGQGLVFATLDNPNFLVSSAADLVDYAGRWFGKLRRRGTLLSGSAERQRERFFTRLDRIMEDLLAEAA